MRMAGSGLPPELMSSETRRGAAHWRNREKSEPIWSAPSDEC